ncbi:MAG: hypothetical protein QJR09_07985 [Micrococcus sp.]|nr:hypothetical protein [Micrococcus sp.]
MTLDVGEQVDPVGEHVVGDLKLAGGRFPVGGHWGGEQGGERDQLEGDLFSDLTFHGGPLAGGVPFDDVHELVGEGAPLFDRAEFVVEPDGGPAVGDSPHPGGERGRDHVNPESCSDDVWRVPHEP